MEKKTARILTFIGILLIIFFLIPIIYLFLADPYMLYIRTGEFTFEFRMITIAIIAIIILIVIMIILVNVFSD